MKNFATFTPRDHELDAGFLQREITVTFTLTGDHSFELAVRDSHGRLDLHRAIEDAATRTITALRGLAIDPNTEPADLPYLNLTLTYDDMEDDESQLGTSISISSGDLLTPESSHTIVATLIRRALPRFETALNLFEVTLS